MERPGNWVSWFGDPLPEGIEDPVHLLGGKGASLKALSRAGLAVPPGFTITTEACRRFFELRGRWPEGLEEEVRRYLDRLEKQTGCRFGQGERPLLLAVRSGAAVSMPGMMDTVLNCGLQEDATPSDRPWDMLVNSINAVFNSFNSERAAAYRRRQGITELDGTAVNVQAMFPSEVSGVLFTEDPTAPDAGRMVIEASHGLGEAVVSGEVTPDRFTVVRDDPAQITSQIAGHEPSLLPEQIAELGRLGLRIEEHFGHPVDLEWGLADGQFALLQARAIRGLDSGRRVESVRRAEIDRLRALADGSRRIWVLHNLAETLSTPTPLTWDVIRRFMSGSGGFGRMYKDLGYRPSSRVCREGFLELIGGQVYADPDRLAEMFWGSVPARYDLDTLLGNRSLLERGTTQFDPDRAGGRFLAMLPVTLWSMVLSAVKLRRLRRHGDRWFEEHVLPAYLGWVQRKRDEELTVLSDEQLLAELHALRVRVLDEFAPESLKPGFAGGLALESLGNLLVQLAGPEEGRALAATLTSALDGDTTFEQNAMLYDVAAGKATLAAFLDRFGHRGHGEMELAEPRWSEDPTYIEQTIARLRRVPGSSPQEIHRSNVARRRAAEEELPRKLAQWGGSSLRERVEFYAERARRLLPYRESGKHYLMMGYELIRRAIEELSRRWELGGDVYFLRLDELAEFPDRRQHLREEIEVRRDHHCAVQKLDLPEVIDSRQLDDLGLPPAVEAVAELTGTGVAPGSAVGRAHVALRPDDASELPSECILVCPSTDPGWTPLFLSARGLVMERGGVLSHGAIVAREFGIPAVVCPGAVRAIASGDRIRVDGHRGRAQILEKAGR